MIVTVVRVADPDRFLRVFETVGVATRRKHRCRGARVYVDPDDPHRMWSVFDWDVQDYESFLADPDIPAIARRLGVRDPVAHLVAAVELDA